MSWAKKEFSSVNLGDKRLNARVAVLAERLSHSPTQSLPNACKGWRELQAGYRFFANDKANWRDILNPHQEQTIERMRTHKVVLNIQDTTELNFNGQQIEGLGPLSYEAQRGMYLHPTYAITPDRIALGVMDAWMWAREFRDADGVRPGIKESTRWIEGYERVAELAQAMPQVRQVYVADREADIYALFSRAQALDYAADLLVRCKHNRSLPGGDKLWARVEQSQALGCVRFEMPAGHGRKARQVSQEIKVERVALDGKVSITCVSASEINAPKGAKPIVWRLLTNRLVDTLEQAMELIEWYRARWEIEMFFLILKQGCRVQALQLGHIESLENALALYMVIAWRINRLMRLGRALPTLPVDLVFEKEEWQAAYILNKKRPPASTPELNTVVRLVAQLGGFIGRKSDGEPGAKTIWLGLEQISLFVEGLQFMREAELD